MVRLTNKSSRDFNVSDGVFKPGTSREFGEVEAEKLLGYSKEIVKTEDAIGDPEFSKLVAGKDEEIAELKDEVKALKAEIVKLKKKLR